MTFKASWLSLLSINEHGRYESAVALIHVKYLYATKTNCNTKEMLVHGKVQWWQVKTCPSVCSHHKQDSLNKLKAAAYMHTG